MASAIRVSSFTTIQTNLSVSFSIRGQVLPKMSLLALDPGWFNFDFQFPPTNLTRNVSTTWGEASSLSMEQPIQQWLKGNLKTITFDAMFFAQHAFQSVEDVTDYLERMSEKDRNLGRPPIWNFVYGRVINEVVLIESIGGIRYGDLRTNANVGTIRDIHFSITLRRYTPYDLEITDPNALPSDTFYVRAKEGDTWEHLAQRQYAKPMLGDVLRKRNPKMAILETNEQAVMPNFENIRSEFATPYSIPLIRTTAAEAIKREIFEDRSQSKYSSVLL